MKIFNANDVLRVAKRLNNKKRNYLLINPLQGKHLPVKPSVALEMMNALGKKVANSFPNAKFVIGFAETATAIGAVVAKNISDDCFYLQTTRENFSGKFIEFLEEHSHAPEQKIFTENFSELISHTNEIILVDDEISTGKTFLNIVRQLKIKFPALNDKKICAASIINRLSEENLTSLAAENISCVYLVKIDKVLDMENIYAESACKIESSKQNYTLHEKFFTSDTRKGVNIGEYFNQCEELGKFIVKMLCKEKISGEILILGTEEFMLPAIIAGNCLERANFSVLTHSTTRSPIGISDEKNYPINEGFKLKSLYNSARTTFIYNLKRYDVAIIVTNAENFSVGLEDLISALNFHGVNKIFCVVIKNV